MAHPPRISGHLWSAALLAAGALVALAADRLSANPAGPSPRTTPALDFGQFAAPLADSGTRQRTPLALRVDPLDGLAGESGVAPRVGGPTVSTSRRTRQLTAILIADERPVAVIDGSVVNVGDTLPDGARITAIRSDRVSIIERTGQHRSLTLSPGGP
jgi:hypothetical protein